MTSVVLACLVWSNLHLLGSRQVKSCIRVVAWQGALLACLIPSRPVFCLVTLAVKAGLIPWLLDRVRRRSRVTRAVEPYLGFTASVGAGVAAFGLAVAIGSTLPSLHLRLPALAIPTSLHLMMVGFLVLTTRHKALSQVLGYLVLENGVFAFGVLTATHTPLVIELALLLDVLGAVLIMGLATFHISQTFQHVDIEKLSVLRH